MLVAGALPEALLADMHAGLLLLFALAPVWLLLLQPCHSTGLSPLCDSLLLPPTFSSSDPPPAAPAPLLTPTFAPAAEQLEGLLPLLLRACARALAPGSALLAALLCTKERLVLLLSPSC